MQSVPLAPLRLNSPRSEATDKIFCAGFCPFTAFISKNLRRLCF